MDLACLVAPAQVPTPFTAFLVVAGVRAVPPKRAVSAPPKEARLWRLSGTHFPLGVLR